jgi:hypothetical protein
MLNSHAHPVPPGGEIPQRCTSVKPCYANIAGNRREEPDCHKTICHLGVGLSVVREWWWICECSGPRPLSWCQSGGVEGC